MRKEEKKIIFEFAMASLAAEVDASTVKGDAVSALAGATAAISLLGDVTR